MKRRIIILTGQREAPFFKKFLLEQNPLLDVAAAHDLEDLTSAIDRFDADARLIAFLSGTIVPSKLLSRLQITPYNIHPGPPEYPGSHPESFAIWEGAQTYGVTAHEMTARVDDGPIVAVYRFPAPPNPGRVQLSNLTYEHAVKVFAVVGAFCAKTDDGRTVGFCEAHAQAISDALQGANPCVIRRGGKTMACLRQRSNQSCRRPGLIEKKHRPYEVRAALFQDYLNFNPLGRRCSHPARCS